MYPFSQVQTLVELVLCKLRPTFISLLANPVPFCSLWDDVLSFPSPSTERMKKLFVIWASTNPFTLAIARLLKTQKTKIAIDCVYTKQSVPRTSSPKVTFPPPFKASLRFRVTRDHLARRWQQVPVKHSFSRWLPALHRLSHDGRSLRYGFSCGATCPEGSQRSFKGVHRSAKALTGNLKLELRLTWCSRDVGFKSGWNQNCLGGHAWEFAILSCINFW